MWSKFVSFCVCKAKPINTTQFHNYGTFFLVKSYRNIYFVCKIFFVKMADI